MHKLTVTLLAAATLLAACNRPQPSEAPAAATPAAVTTPAPSATTPPVGSANEATSEVTATNAADEARIDQSIDNVLGDHATYRQVIADFQAAVVANDAAKAAELVHYPISVDTGGKHTVIKDASGFVQNYEKFMTPEIAKAITATQYGNVMVNDQGVMLGQGEAWINGVCQDRSCKEVAVKVVTIQPTTKPSP